MSNAISRLRELLKDSGLVVTFSPWCISGLVPDCACSRCLKEKGLPVTDETEAAAEVRSQMESKEFRQRVFDSMNHQPKSQPGGEV